MILILLVGKEQSRSSSFLDAVNQDEKEINPKRDIMTIVSW
ncbi:MAG: hypothetical protein QXZ70_08460 [Candidatus Bathyarchaeia archaeon]